MKYSLLYLLLFSSFIVANEACYENKFSSDILACQKNAYVNSKTKYEFTLNELATGKIQAELKQSILNAETDWLNLSQADCGNYLFYIEPNNITYDIAKNECMAEKFNQRLKFVENMKEMVNDFE